MQESIESRLEYLEGLVEILVVEIMELKKLTRKLRPN